MKDLIRYWEDRAETNRDMANNAGSSYEYERLRATANTLEKCAEEVRNKLNPPGIDLERRRAETQ